MCFSTVEFSRRKAEVSRNFVNILAGAIAESRQFMSNISPKSYQKVAKMEGGVPKKRTGDHFWRPEAQDGHQEVTMVGF